MTLRFLTAGESHGPGLTVIVDGLPAGLAVDRALLDSDLRRRQGGYGRGGRMKIETDTAEVTAGVRHGRTLGSPVAIRVGNSEWPKWQTVMAADPVDPGVLAGQARNAPLTRPRPGHADLAGMQKYGHTDARPILERASARETAARVPLGVVAKHLLEQGLGVRIVSHVVELGPVAVKPGLVAHPDDAERIDAVAKLGFTPRQAGFLVTVAMHAGVCLSRHYATYAGLVWGQIVRDFFALLLKRRFVTPMAVIGGASFARSSSSTQTKE